MIYKSLYKIKCAFAIFLPRLRKKRRELIRIPVYAHRFAGLAGNDLCVKDNIRIFGLFLTLRRRHCVLLFSIMAVCI